MVVQQDPYLLELERALSTMSAPSLGMSQPEMQGPPAPPPQQWQGPPQAPQYGPPQRPPQAPTAPVVGIPELDRMLGQVPRATSGPVQTVPTAEQDTRYQREKLIKQAQDDAEFRQAQLDARQKVESNERVQQLMQSRSGRQQLYREMMLERETSRNKLLRLQADSAEYELAQAKKMGPLAYEQAKARLDESIKTMKEYDANDQLRAMERADKKAQLQEAPAQRRLQRRAIESNIAVDEARIEQMGAREIPQPTGILGDLQAQLLDPKYKAAGDLLRSVQELGVDPATGQASPDIGATKVAQSVKPEVVDQALAQITALRDRYSPVAMRDLGAGRPSEKQVAESNAELDKMQATLGRIKLLSDRARNQTTVGANKPDAKQMAAIDQELSNLTGLRPTSRMTQPTPTYSALRSMLTDIATPNQVGNFQGGREYGVAQVGPGAANLGIYGQSAEVMGGTRPLPMTKDTLFAFPTSQQAINALNDSLKTGGPNAQAAAMLMLGVGTEEQRLKMRDLIAKRYGINNNDIAMLLNDARPDFNRRVFEALKVYAGGQ